MFQLSSLQTRFAMAIDGITKVSSAHVWLMIRDFPPQSWYRKYQCGGSIVTKRQTKQITELFLILWHNASCVVFYKHDSSLDISLPRAILQSDIVLWTSFCWESFKSMRHVWADSGEFSLRNTWEIWRSCLEQNCGKISSEAPHFCNTQSLFGRHHCSPHSSSYRRDQAQFATSYRGCWNSFPRFYWSIWLRQNFKSAW